MNIDLSITPEKLRAYNASEYSFNYHNFSIILRIGEHSADLENIFKTNDVYCGAFLTAFNPYGQPQPEHLNTISNKLLLELLSNSDLQIFEGAGSEPGTNWPAEKSYFVLGITLIKASELGNMFKQDAIVWVDSNAIPQLVTLR